MASNKACCDLNDSLRAILECPVCLELCQTPIFICSNGHLVCNSCQPSLDHCPTCRLVGRPTGRCPPLEKMADKVKLPCANKREGCVAVLNAEDMAEHWERCKSVYVYVCLVNSQTTDLILQCGWSGDRRALVDHVKEKHPGSYSEEDIVRCQEDNFMQEDYESNKLVSAHGELFWICFLYWEKSKTAYIHSKYISEGENAGNYRVKIVYYSSDGSFENTSVADTIYVYNPYWNSSSVLRLVRSTLEKSTINGCFSYTAQILKR